MLLVRQGLSGIIDGAPDDQGGDDTLKFCGEKYGVQSPLFASCVDYYRRGYDGIYVPCIAGCSPGVLGPCTNTFGVPCDSTTNSTPPPDTDWSHMSPPAPTPATPNLPAGPSSVPKIVIGKSTVPTAGTQVNTSAPFLVVPKGSAWYMTWWGLLGIAAVGFGAYKYSQRNKSAVAKP